MLPSSLKSIYHQYKADTDSVATWLATTAKANGYVDDTGNALVTAGGKKKKKKKKKANTNKPRYVLRIKDFEPMAKFIANLESISLPEEFAIALERVIWVRKTFVDLLTANGIPTKGDSDATHSYFADVLEKVGKWLQPLVKPPAFKAPEPKDDPKEGDNPLKNIFDVLEVYTPSEEFLNAPATAAPKPTPDVEYTVEEEDTLGDAIFALVALLDDFTRLREEVRSLWKRHLEGSLDLAAAAVATNTAFELARSMEDEVKPLLDKHDGVDELITVYFINICQSCGVDALSKGEGEPYNLVAYDFAKACFANGLTMLRDYAVGNANVYIISKYNGKFGWYDEARGDTATTNRGKWDQDFTAFNGVITELQFLSSNMGQGARIEDEMIRGVGALMNSTEDGGEPDMSLWLSFAMQTYIEVLQSFGKNCGDAYEQMQQECRRIKKAMLQVPRTSKDRDSVLNSVTKWDKDPIWHCRHKMIRLGVMPRPNPPQFQFLRRNPIHCGLLLHEIRTNFHISGVRYAAHSGGLMVTTQLYHALHNEKLLPEEVVWEDLDEFWKRQGNSAFFVGDPPTDREGYFRNYCLSIGLSASNWAPTKRQGKVNVNTANRRNLKFNGWVSLVMKNRLVPTGDRPPLSADMIEGILLDGRRHEIMDGKGHVRTELKERTEDDKVDLVNLSPAGLIEKLALDIHDDVPKITFDLFTLHNTAWDLLTKLKAEFTKIMGPEFLKYVPREELLPYVAGYVFSTAAGRQDIETKTESVDILINAAGRFVKGFLEKGKGRVVKEGRRVTVKPQEVANIQFNEIEPWGLGKLMAELQREAASRAMGGRKGRGGGGEECPVHTRKHRLLHPCKCHREYKQRIRHEGSCSSKKNDRVVRRLLDQVWTTLNRPGLAVFAIGGDVQKPDASPGTASSSLAIRWDRDEQGQCRKLLLPMRDDPASKESFDMILKDCQPATFGVGGKEVLDEEYRKAGKLDDTTFSTSFNPYEHGIMDTINQVLAQGEHREGLGVRAEMYKLNVYSGPSGKFKAHVDTPRSDRQMGSLVVCLPVAHKGGQLVVRHRGNQVKFDWGPKSADTIQWGAFFSDCEHEVLKVTKGHRMTLTYNLFWTTYGPASMADNLKALDQESLHFYSALQKLFDCEHFLSDGGLVGFTCAHAYPHTSESSMKDLHHMLKGIDMVVYQALKRLLGSAGVTAVLDDSEYQLYLSEQRYGDDDEEVNDDCVSTSLKPVLSCDEYEEDTTADPGTIANYGPGPAFPRRGVTWLNHAPNSRTATEFAVAFIAYGNEPRIDAYYSSAVILAEADAVGED